MPTFSCTDCGLPAVEEFQGHWYCFDCANALYDEMYDEDLYEPNFEIFPDEPWLERDEF